jgi:hypothetical protein
VSEPLPVYPEFRLKAEAITQQIAGSGAVATEFVTLVMGGLLRTWLYAQLNGKGKDFAITAEVATIDRTTGVPGLAAAMIEKGWLVVKGGQLLFPGLKQYKKERKKADWDAKLNEPGATVKVAWFEDFWAAYVVPDGRSKGAKQEALAEWLRIGGLDADLAIEITACTRRHVASGWKVLNGYACHARRYLHQRMWQDAPPPKPIRSPAPPRPLAGPGAGDPGAGSATDWIDAQSQYAGDAEPQGPVPSIAELTGRTRGKRTTGSGEPPAAES